MACLFADSLGNIGPVGLSHNISGSTQYASLYPQYLQDLLTANGITYNRLYGSSYGNDGYVFVSSPLLSNDVASLGVNSSGDTFSNVSVNLGGNVGTIIGSVYLSTDLVHSFFISFFDGNNIQCSIGINFGSGTISLVQGSINRSGPSPDGSTVVATSTAAIPSNSATCISWSIGIGPSSAYQINIGSTVALSGTVDTNGGSSNHYVNSVMLGYFRSTINENVGTYGGTHLAHLILADTTGSTMNTMWTNSPVVLEQAPIADAVAQFTPASIILGIEYQINGSSQNGGSSFHSQNNIIYQKYIPDVNMQLNSISTVTYQTASGANYQCAIYADNSGAPGNLIASTSTNTGINSYTPTSSAFASPVSLTGGTAYWLAFNCDSYLNLMAPGAGNGTNNAYAQSQSYSSGFPSTAGSLSSGQNNIQIGRAHV